MMRKAGKTKEMLGDRLCERAARHRGAGERVCVCVCVRVCVCDRDVCDGVMCVMVLYVCV